LCVIIILQTSIPLIDALHFPPWRTTSEQSQTFRRPSLIVSLLDEGEKGSKAWVCPEVTRPMALDIAK